MLTRSASLVCGYILGGSRKASRDPNKNSFQFVVNKAMIAFRQGNQTNGQSAQMKGIQIKPGRISQTDSQNIQGKLINFALNGIFLQKTFNLYIG